MVWHSCLLSSHMCRGKKGPGHHHRLRRHEHPGGAVSDARERGLREGSHAGCRTRHRGGVSHLVVAPQSHHGPVLVCEEYVGSAGTSEPIPCTACQSGSLGSGAAHATCCALGEATRGHTALTALIHAAAQSCDHTAETEVPGLVPGTDLRPADVHTSALCNSPQAQQPGPDCTRSRLVATHDYCGPHFPSLLGQNISYTLIVWIAHGRPHQDTLTVVRSTSKSIVRKRNFVSAEVVFQRLHSSARQIRSCWPLASLSAPLDIDLQSPPPLASPGVLLCRPCFCSLPDSVCARVYGRGRLCAFRFFRRACPLWAAPAAGGSARLLGVSRIRSLPCPRPRVNFAQRARLSHWPGDQELPLLVTPERSCPPPPFQLTGSCSWTSGACKRHQLNSRLLPAHGLTARLLALERLPPSWPRRSSSGAAKAWRRSRVKRRRRTRKQAKRSMWREI